MYVLIVVNRDLDRLKKLLAQEDSSPKYREYIQAKIEESSPVDYRQEFITKPTAEGVRSDCI